MSTAEVGTNAAVAAIGDRFGGGRPRRRGKRTAAAVVAVIVIAAIVLGVTRPFGNNSAKTSASGVVDNAYPTSTSTVTRQDISQKTSVNATLGYAGSYSITAPSGATAQQVAQAQQTVIQDQQTLSADQQTESDKSTADDQAIAAAQSTVNADLSTLSADEASESMACAGTGASAPACSQAQQKVSQDQAKLAQAQQQLASAQSNATIDHDQNQAKVASDQTKLQGDQAALASLRSTAVTTGTTYSWLPAVGDIVKEDQPVYALTNHPVPLLYGSIPASRAFYLGMSDGADVGELTGDLIVLGYGAGLTQSDHYSTATASAVDRWQRALGLPVTGEILLGQAIFEPGPLRVTSVTASLGQAVGAGDGTGGGGGGGTVLSATSTARQVTINLDAALQSEVKAGQKVGIVLPSGAITPGVISSVGTVATTPSGGGSPTITVEVTPTDPAATGRVDQAPVTVTITTATASDVLAVPIDALLGLSTGGYAVEVIDVGGIHHLVDVSLGLFDDADGLVQVTGSGLAAGQHVVVPAL